MANIIFIGEGFYFDALFEMLKEAGHNVTVSQQDYSHALGDLGATLVFTDEFDNYKVNTPNHPYDLVVLQIHGLPVGCEMKKGGLLYGATEFDPGYLFLKVLRSDPSLEWARNTPVLLNDAGRNIDPDRVSEASPNDVYYYDMLRKDGMKAQIEELLALTAK